MITALITPDGPRSAEEIAARVAGVELPEGPFGRLVPIVAGTDEDAIVRILAAMAAHRPMVLLHPRWTDAERERFLASIVVPPDERTFAIFATSGSTGRPKAVELTRDAFVAAAAGSAARLGWRPDDRWHLTIPLAHVGGFSVLIRCLLAGRPIVLGDDVARATITSVVPTQLARLVDRPPPPSLRLVLVGGAALPPSLRERSASWPVRATYGMTEACAQIATQVHRDQPGVGPPLDGVALRIEAGGAIAIRGPTLFRRYATGEPAGFDEGGWFRTGDLGRLDDGCLTVLGRADDLIVTGGENVFPAEVEDALRVAGARDAVVFGASDDTWGQTVVAAIEGELPDPSRLDDHLARFKRPRKVAALDVFPRTAVGKVDRQTVARLATPSLAPWEFAKRAAE